MDVTLRLGDRPVFGLLANDDFVGVEVLGWHLYWTRGYLTGRERWGRDFGKWAIAVEREARLINSPSL